MSDISIIGAGYVGLTTGACLASIGHHVTCIDNDARKVSMLELGEIPIFEPGLQDIVKSGLSSGRLVFTENLKAGVKSSEFVFLCLPTPEQPDGSADTSYVEAVVRDLGPLLKSGSVVIYKSTMPIRSHSLIRKLLNRDDIGIASNPEFLREGSAVSDFLTPDRVLIGSDDAHVGERVASIYSSFEAPIVITDAKSAETIKYLSNAYLALKISFVNESARFCDAVDSNLKDVLYGLSLDPRIGSQFLSPGPGWGGSCFPKDTKALLHTASDHGFDFNLIRHAVISNDIHQEEIAASVIRLLTANQRHQGAVVTALGLAFKAGTDDTRRSPALTILRHLQDHVKEIRCYDPFADLNDDPSFTRLTTPLEALKGADIAVVLTEWDEFAQLNPADIKNSMRGNVILDTRYILDKEMYRSHGLVVVSVGIPRNS